MDEESTRWELEGEALVLHLWLDVGLVAESVVARLVPGALPPFCMLSLPFILKKKMIRSSLSIKVEEKKKEFNRGSCTDAQRPP